MIPPCYQPCPHCGKPTIAYSEATSAFNEIDFYPDLAGEPTHVPTLREKFYFNCGFSR